MRQLMMTNKRMNQTKTKTSGFFYGWIIVGFSTFALLVSNGLSIGGIPVFYKPIQQDLLQMGTVTAQTKDSVTGLAAGLTFLLAGIFSLVRRASDSKIQLENADARRFGDFGKRAGVLFASRRTVADLSVAFAARIITRTRRRNGTDGFNRQLVSAQARTGDGHRFDGNEFRRRVDFDCRASFD